MTIETDPQKWAARIAGETAAQGAHMFHLLADPCFVGVPLFNTLPTAPVEFIPGLADYFPLIHLPHNGTRAHIDIGLLAHTHECAGGSCTEAWTAAQRRRTAYGAPTYVLKGGTGRTRPVHRAVITPIDRHLSTLRALVWMGADPSAISDGRAYEVTAETAADLAAGRTPRVSPLAVRDHGAR